ncbi:hypothetical protein VNO80_09908 [Phaseolus coccineus]|uniref:Uncharacterized protein n=1 Tax=Phaseolus coccineus TaxID=3886 RepID=A0AAN9NCE9_PHACN
MITVLHCAKIMGLLVIPGAYCPNRDVNVASEVVEENKHERDDSNIGHDGEKIEEEEFQEVEHLIDKQDIEKDEKNEDEDGQDTGKQMKDMHILENEDHNGSRKDIQLKSEKYKQIDWHI